MATKTYDDSEILAKKPQPTMPYPPQEDSTSGGQRTFNALGLKLQDGEESAPPNAVDPV